jgi:hypothetical protein
LRRDPIRCPKCDATFDPEAVLKSRRVRGVGEEVAEKPKQEAEESKVDLESEEEEVVADDEDGEILEDASDLGDDDMSEVIDAADDQEDT